MLRRGLSLIWLIFVVNSGFAAEVVFVVGHRDGRLVQLEPDGRFFHVAIRYQGRWLQAHSHNGVELVDTILPFGDGFQILRHPDVPEPSSAQIEAWLGKGFDQSYSWDCATATYCTRLVANLLGVPPRPMTFDAEVWARYGMAPRGALGLSPDELHAELIARGFRPVSRCEYLAKGML